MNENVYTVQCRDHKKVEPCKVLPNEVEKNLLVKTLDKEVPVFNVK
jgi:hypothetical protein